MIGDSRCRSPGDRDPGLFARFGFAHQRNTKTGCCFLQNSLRGVAFTQPTSIAPAVATCGTRRRRNAPDKSSSRSRSVGSAIAICSFRFRAAAAQTDGAPSGRPELAEQRVVDRRFTSVGNKIDEEQAVTERHSLACLISGGSAAKGKGAESGTPLLMPSGCRSVSLVLLHYEWRKL